MTDRPRFTLHDLAAFASVKRLHAESRLQVHRKLASRADIIADCERELFLCEAVEQLVARYIQLRRQAMAKEAA
jgi:hypothetical protein